MNTDKGSALGYEQPVPGVYQVYCQSGVIRGERFEVSSQLTVGREAHCDVILDDPKVSRHHGTFLVRNGELHFRDNGSTNGTLVNGQRITEAEVRLGDIIKIGTSEFAILEESDFRTINFVHAESTVTGIVNTAAVKPDALADKFAQIFDYYREHQPEISEAERFELVRTQRLLNGLKTIYSMSQTLTKLVSMDELLKRIAENLFEVFAGAENVVILIDDPARKMVVPRLARARGTDREPEVNISRTVVDRAIRERCTLITSDTAQDERFANSDSIIGFQVKSVICAPLVSGEVALGALYIDNRLQNVHYDELDAEVVTAFANQCAVAIDNAKLVDSLQQHYHQTLQTLVNAIEARDAYTKGHTERVSLYSVGIAREMGLDPGEVERIRIAADLHDVGKIGVREGIINKAGKLSDTEFSSVKDHVEMGERILEPILYLRPVLPYIRGHHERWDGSGYPDGLVGDECCLGARIIGVADVFDAMTSQRSYNKPLSFSEAVDKIRELSGKLFDPKVVDAFEGYAGRDLVHGSEVASGAERNDAS